MKIKIPQLLATISAAFVLAGTVLHGVPAGAQDTQSMPVTVQDCVSTAATPQLTFPGLSGAASITQPGTPAMVIIAYTNTAQTPISSIDFGLLVDGKVATMFRDMGTFAPQVHIMHAFAVTNKNLPYMRAAMSCVPLRIRYTDGTSWMNPAASKS